MEIQTLQTRTQFKEFAAGITIGENVILRIRPGERGGSPNYVYFIGQGLEREKKLCANGRYRSTWFQKNDYIVKKRWYYLSSIKSTGDCIYKKW